MSKHSENIKHLAKEENIPYMDAQARYYSDEFKEKREAMLAMPRCADCDKLLDDCKCDSGQGILPGQELKVPPKCPNCEGKMKLRKGPYGSFWGCRKYPECKGIVGIESKEPPKIESLEEVQSKMERTLAYVKEIGSTYEARKYIEAVISLLESQ